MMDFMTGRRWLRYLLACALGYCASTLLDFGLLTLLAQRFYPLMSETPATMTAQVIALSLAILCDVLGGLVVASVARTNAVALAVGLGLCETAWELFQGTLNLRRVLFLVLIVPAFVMGAALYTRLRFRRLRDSGSDAHETRSFRSGLVIAGVGLGALSLLAAVLYSTRPRVEIEPDISSDAGELSSEFVVTNKGHRLLNDVNFYCTTHFKDSSVGSPDSNQPVAILGPGKRVKIYGGQAPTSLAPVIGTSGGYAFVSDFEIEVSGRPSYLRDYEHLTVRFVGVKEDGRMRWIRQSPHEN